MTSSPLVAVLLASSTLTVGLASAEHIIPYAWYSPYVRACLDIQCPAEPTRVDFHLLAFYPEEPVCPPRQATCVERGEVVYDDEPAVPGTLTRTDAPLWACVPESPQCAEPASPVRRTLVSDDGEFDLAGNALLVSGGVLGFRKDVDLHGTVHGEPMSFVAGS